MDVDVGGLNLALNRVNASTLKATLSFEIIFI
jgi:hypothetical protein